MIKEVNSELICDVGHWFGDPLGKNVDDRFCFQWRERKQLELLKLLNNATTLYFSFGITLSLLLNIEGP